MIVETTRQVCLDSPDPRPILDATAWDADISDRDEKRAIKAMFLVVYGYTVSVCEQHGAATAGWIVDQRI